MPGRPPRLIRAVLLSAGCVVAGCSTEWGEFRDDPGAQLVQVGGTFGQFATVGATDVAAHFMVLELDPDNIEVRVPATGVLSFENGFEDLGNCFILDPAVRMDASSPYEGLDRSLPRAAALQLAFCGYPGDDPAHPDYATWTEGLDALWDELLDPPIRPGYYGESFVSATDQEGFEVVEVVADPADLARWSSLGAVPSGTLTVAAFRDKTLGGRVFVNPAPYIAGLPDLGTAWGLDGQPPTLASVGMEEAPTPDFDAADVNVKTFDIHGDISPAVDLGGYVRVQIELTPLSDADPGGPTVVPYEVAYTLTQLTDGDGIALASPEVVARATVHLNELKVSDGAEIGELLYRTGSPLGRNTDPSTNSYWLYVPLRVAASPDDAGKVRNVDDDDLSEWMPLAHEAIEAGADMQLEISVRDAFTEAGAGDSKTVFFTVDSDPTSVSSPVDFDLSVTHALATHPDGDLVSEVEWTSPGFWLVHNGDDDDLDGAADSANDTVDDDADLDDLATVVVDSLGGEVHADAVLHVRTDGTPTGTVRVFHQTGVSAADAVEILDTSSDSQTDDTVAADLLAELSAGDLTLLLEGTAQGEVTLCVEYHHDVYDEPRCVLVRVAPHLVVDLDADIDDDGVYTEIDEALEGEFDTSRTPAGLVVGANVDDDDGDDASDQSDIVVNGADDLLDMHPLRVADSGLGAAEWTATGFSAELGFDAAIADAVRLYWEWTASAAALVDDSAGSDSAHGDRRVVAYDLTTGSDTYVPLEARRFWHCTGGDCNDPANVLSGGDLWLHVYASDGTIVAYDRVHVRLAPFLLRSHLDGVSALYYEDDTTDVTSSWKVALNAELHADISAEIGAGPPTIQIGDANDAWFQDQTEIGYASTGSGYIPTALLLPRQSFSPADALADWYLANVLDAGVGMFGVPGFEQGGGIVADSPDFGGNIEVTPPVPGYDFGRVYTGSNASAVLTGFFEAQQYQEPFYLPVDWLAVGHVDEVTAIVSDADAADTPDFKVLLADPDLARELLEGSGGHPITAPGPHRAVFYDGAEAHGTGSSSSTSTELAYDTLAFTYNPDSHADLDDATWTYLRIYDGTGAGQVAHVVDVTSSTLEIDRVWEIPDAEALAKLKCDAWEHNTHHAATWFDTPDDTSEFVLVEEAKNVVYLANAETRFSASEYRVDGDNYVLVPGLTTVGELLADSALWTFNDSIRPCLRKGAAGDSNTPGECDPAVTPGPTSTEEAFEDALGRSNAEFIPLPVVYSYFAAGLPCTVNVVDPLAAALFPNAVNVQAFPDLVVAPRQFGPRNASGEDVFEAYVEAVLPALDLLWVDDWDVLHNGDGEVHCGTNLKGASASPNWWEADPP